jgi:5-methylcytosine-specific restriction endonuclease McrA
MKKKSDRKKAVESADREMSLYIRARDGRCVVCGSRERLTNGHLFSRVSYSTRWDEDNCMAQCVACNYNHERDFEPFRQKFVDNGIDIDKLHAKYKQVRKYTTAEIWEIAAYYREKRRQYDRG